MLLVFLITANACGSNKGCGGKGGWYGDRNLTDVSPKLLDYQKGSVAVLRCEP